jgi:hypothetical protein
MGRALILRIYGRHLQKPAGVIILHFNKLVHHIGGLLSLAFVQKERQQSKQLVWGTQDDHEITTRYSKDSRHPSECKGKKCSLSLLS